MMNLDERTISNENIDSMLANVSEGETPEIRPRNFPTSEEVTIVRNASRSPDVVLDKPEQ